MLAQGEGRRLVRAGGGRGAGAHRQAHVAEIGEGDRAEAFEAQFSQQNAAGHLGGELAALLLLQPLGQQQLQEQQGQGRETGSAGAIAKPAPPASQRGVRQELRGEIRGDVR